MNYDRRSIVADDEVEDIDTEFGELQIADYVVFLLALDTYLRWMKEVGATTDDVMARGVTLLRALERQHLDRIAQFMRDGISNPSALRMLEAAIKLPPTARGASIRALRLRTILSKGGSATVKHVFGSATRARREVLDAIESSMVDEASAAFAKFSTITLRDKRLQQWVAKANAAVAAGAPVAPADTNPVHEASKQVGEGAESLLNARVRQEAASPASETHAAAQSTQAEVLRNVEQKAAEAAAQVLTQTGQPDVPPTRSEVIGIATAAATAVANDPVDLKNVPPAFINEGRSLDPEQMDAAKTNGKVLVAAGAGAGKSTTLVSRIAYLVDNLNTNPSRIMAVSFNKKAAVELQEKIQKKIGAERGKAVMCDTMHTVFRKFIIGDPKMGIPAFGTPEEQQMMTENLIAPNAKGRAPTKVKPGDLSRAILNIWNQCSPEQLSAYTGWPVKLFKDGPPKAKKAGLYINKWAGNDVTLQQAKLSARTDPERLASVYYEFYLGLKGDIPGWRPPAGFKAYDAFMSRFRRGGERLGDMDDMLKIFRDILRRDPKAQKTVQGMYDHMLIDEAQDSNTIQHQIFDMISEHVECDDPKKSIWLVGDDRQCVASDTPVLTPTETVPAGRLKPGDQVLAYRNGEIVAQTVRHVVPSSWTWGYRITTESGKTLLMSPNHKLWATSPEMGEDRTIVYLMYREDMGFRVGITDKCEDPENPYGSRAQLERAERLWVLELCESREEALFREEFYSLKYGIPTMVFEGADRGLNMDRIARVFAEFGKNGAKLLEDRHLSFDLPNWMAYSYTKFGTVRRTIQLVMHANKGSQVALEWMGNDLDHVMTDIKHERLDGNRHRLRKFFGNYREALGFAEALKAKTGAQLRKRLSTPEGPMAMLTASALVVSMSVPVRSGDTILHERIVSIEKVGGSFVDLDVDDASNFFGGDILTSNSIYQFRGAKPELFQKHWNDGCWKPKMIRTNYRCPPEVVEIANRLVSHNPARLPVDATPSPYRTRGEASVQMRVVADNSLAAIVTVADIRKDIESDPAHYRPEDYAVLARTNRELNDFETACIINEIPYMRRGGSGFLDAPESKAVLGYIDLASGTNFEKKQMSLVDALLKPDRGLFLGPDKIEKAVQEAVDDVARNERKDVKDVDPEILLTNRTYARKLAEYLKGPYKNQLMAKGAWLWNKIVDQLTVQILGMGRDVEDIRNITQTPDAKTEDLLAYILDNVKGTQTNWDPNLRREVVIAQSLRENIVANLKLAGDDDDDLGEESDKDDTGPEMNSEGRPVQQNAPPNPAKGLGAIRFLFEMSLPNKNDHDLGILPNTAGGFAKKIERYAKIAEGLRIDPKKWEDAQAQITDPKLRQSKPPAVTLTTVHSVKGLEWPHCTVLMPKGLFPIELSVKPGEEPPTDQEMFEHDVSERNLAYVAFTRAAKTLTVMAIPQMNKLSPYIRDAGLKPGENVPKPGAEVSPDPDPDIKTASTEDLTEGVWHYEQWPRLGASVTYDRRMP